MRILLLVTLAALIALGAVWDRMSHLNVDVRSYSIIFAIFLAFMAASFFYDRIRKDVCISSMLFGLGFIIIYSSTLNVINYFGLTIAGPRIDNLLAAMDRAIGVDWPALMAYMAQHPRINFVLLMVYQFSVWQVVTLILALGWKDRGQTIEQLCLALFICGMITVGIWIAFPSFGAITVYGLPPEIAAKLSISLDLKYAHELLEIWAKGPGVISPVTIRGLVAFPSFHTAQAVIVIWYARKLKILFYPFLVFNILVIASTPIQGGHHIVDVIGGLAVAALAIWLASMVASRLMRAHSRNQSAPALAVAG